jgi:NADPH:quinone reductase-like Zn-dependent oxidoreductase
MLLYRLPKAQSIDDLTLVEAAAPRPGRGQALVRMRAASLNYRDLMVVSGHYGRGTARANLVPLSDGAGEVIAVGPDVTRVKPGDRVAGIFMQSWTGGEISAADGASAMGGGIDGVLAEEVVFEESGLVHLPAHLSFEEGATLPCAAVTAWNALYGLRPVQAGQSVLLLGTGGVSIFALQFAHAAGARVIATSSSDQKLAKAKSLGASDGINYKTTPEWQESVRTLTGGRGVDHVVEVGGAGTLPRSIQATRMGGTISVIGGLSGSAGEINPSAIIRHNVTLRGVYVGSRELFEAMNRAISLHKLRPVIDRTFPFKEAKAAYRHLQSQTHLGKVVITVA